MPKQVPSVKVGPAYGTTKDDLAQEIAKAWGSKEDTLIDKQAYNILLTSGLISKDGCPKCEYAPILNWFNYCPMCECPVNRK